MIFPNISFFKASDVGTEWKKELKLYRATVTALILLCKDRKMTNKHFGISMVFQDDTSGDYRRILLGMIGAGY